MDMTREQLDYFSECVKVHFGYDSTAMNAAHYGLMWAETKVDDGELIGEITRLEAGRAELVSLLDRIRSADIAQKVNAGSFFLPQSIRGEIQNAIDKYKK